MRISKARQHVHVFNCSCASCSRLKARFNQAGLQVTTIKKRDNKVSVKHLNKKGNKTLQTRLGLKRTINKRSKEYVYKRGRIVFRKQKGYFD